MPYINEPWHICPVHGCNYWSSASAVQRHSAAAHAATNSLQNVGCKPANDLVSNTDGQHWKLIFRAWKFNEEGHKIWARDYGRRAWAIQVPASK